MVCNTDNIQNREHVPTENIESSSEHEGSIKADNGHCSIKKQSDLFAYRRRKRTSVSNVDYKFSGR